MSVQREKNLISGDLGSTTEFFFPFILKSSQKFVSSSFSAGALVPRLGQWWRATARFAPPTSMSKVQQGFRINSKTERVFSWEGCKQSAKYAVWLLNFVCDKTEMFLFPSLLEYYEHQRSSWRTSQQHDKNTSAHITTNFSQRKLFLWEDLWQEFEYIKATYQMAGETDFYHLYCCYSTRVTMCNVHLLQAKTHHSLWKCNLFACRTRAEHIHSIVCGTKAWRLGTSTRVFQGSGYSSIFKHFP